MSSSYESIENQWDNVPPHDALEIGDYYLNPGFKEAVYQKFPYYTAEEIIGTYLGHNPYFPSQNQWEVGENEDDNAHNHGEGDDECEGWDCDDSCYGSDDDE